MSKENAMRELSVKNLLWDGQPVTVDRRTSESFTVRNARFTMAMQVQSGVIQSFFESSKGLARDTGFMARFLLAWPESAQGTRRFADSPESWPRLAQFEQRLADILKSAPMIDVTGALLPTMLTLTPAAKVEWVRYHDAIELQLGNGGALFDVRDVASKSADNAARLAALFHVFCGKSGAIDFEAMKSGTCIAHWHLQEARRFFDELVLPKRANTASF